MDHKTISVKLLTKDGESKELTSNYYNFEIEDILVDRFGADKLKKLHETGKLDFNLTLEDVEEDIPHLLHDYNQHNIDLRKSDFDEILRIYSFFVLYKRNALLRQMQSERETLASNLEQLEVILNSMPQDVLTKLNSKIMTNKSSLTTTQKN